jgi:(p)ppGpp synthase/HD superfamily hydrolase
MHSYAQTNLQLCNQMLKANYSEPDLQLVLKGYELAIQLFSGRYRANGKPFLAHLVGTASILVAQEAPAQVVVAGLLHAAYAQGNFADGQMGITEARQKTVVAAVGEVIEALVARYTNFPWNVQSIEQTLKNVHGLDEAAQPIILMRLANDLEDHLDLGMLYCQKSESAPVDVEMSLAVEIAKVLGYASLGEELQQTVQAEAIATIPKTLQRTEKVSFDSLSLTQTSSFQWRRFLKNRLPRPVVSGLKQARSLLRA